jgi:5-methylcytosine-specific restriction endonuclease McrA
MGDCSTKQCSKCGEVKPLAEFYNCKRKKDHLTDWCKGCNKASAQRWNQENKEQYNTNAKLFRERHPETVRVNNHEYYSGHKAENRESGNRWRDANRDKVRESNRLAKKAHPEQRQADDERRRSRKENAEGNYSANDIKKQNKIQKGRCYYCGQKKKLTIDHIVPLSRGGSNWPSNIVLACGSCNSKKHNKLPHEWSEGGRLI